MKKKILFTGGGTAGHVTVNLALIPHFIQEGWEVNYIGSEKGIERELITPIAHVNYSSISTGKLRRYFDWQNFKDPFKVVKGVYEAYRQIKKIKPDVIFSKGGFVSVPVILGGWLNRVPIIIHESDLTPGLANRISIPFATKVCITFPETEKYLRSDKVAYVGAIVRPELQKGNRDKGYQYCKFTPGKPVLLIMGGSSGARRINQAIRANLKSLLSQFQIVHICGKGETDQTIKERGYKQFEYVSEELPDLLNMADLVISRAGANSIFEFLSLRKPMLLVPLSKEASRGDQILNAQSFERAGYCEVIQDGELMEQKFVETINQMYINRTKYESNMSQRSGVVGIEQVIQLIEEVAK